MDTPYPLTVYFDASCGLCHREMHNIVLHDARHRLIMVDCSAAEFDDTPFRSDGITRASMMERLHVRDSFGTWVKGAPAIELLYRTVGMQALAAFWGGRYTRALMARLYPWIARNRQAISGTGLPLLFLAWGKVAAARAYKRSRRCHDGQCAN